MTCNYLIEINRAHPRYRDRQIGSKALKLCSLIAELFGHVRGRWTLKNTSIFSLITIKRIKPIVPKALLG